MVSTFEDTCYLIVGYEGPSQPNCHRIPSLDFALGLLFKRLSSQVVLFTSGNFFEIKMNLKSYNLKEILPLSNLKQF